MAAPPVVNILQPYDCKIVPLKEIHFFPFGDSCGKDFDGFPVIDIFAK